MRLEHDHDAPVDTRPSSRNHGGNLGRMMSVVVYDHHAAFFAEKLEPAFGAAELFQGSCDPAKRDTNLETHGHCTQRIQQVVTAWHTERQLSEFDTPPVRQTVHDGAMRSERLDANAMRAGMKRKAYTGMRML